MGALTYLLIWTGYSVFALGVGTVRGCNVKWTQVAWPGRWTGCHPDSPGGGNAAPGQTGGKQTAGFKSAVDKALAILNNPKSTNAQKQQAVQQIANAGASTPL